MPQMGPLQSERANEAVQKNIKTEIKCPNSWTFNEKNAIYES